MNFCVFENYLSLKLTLKRSCESLKYWSAFKINFLPPISWALRLKLEQFNFFCFVFCQILNFGILVIACQCQEKNYGKKETILKNKNFPSCPFSYQLNHKNLHPIGVTTNCVILSNLGVHPQPFPLTNLSCLPAIQAFLPQTVIQSINLFCGTHTRFVPIHSSFYQSFILSIWTNNQTTLSSLLSSSFLFLLYKSLTQFNFPYTLYREVGGVWVQLLRGLGARVRVILVLRPRSHFYFQLGSPAGQVVYPPG